MYKSSTLGNQWDGVTKAPVRDASIGRSNEVKSRCQFLIFRHLRMFECWTGLIMTQSTSGALQRKTVTRNIAARPRVDDGILRAVWLSTVSAAFSVFVLGITL